MDVTSSIPAAIGVLAMQSPLLILYLVGIVIALFTWARHPRTSLFTIIALGALVVLTITSNLFYTLLPVYFMRNGNSTTQTGTILAVVGFVFNLLHTVAFGLLLAAIFGERANKSNA